MHDLIVLDTVDSTNAEVRRRGSAAPLPHGLTIVARHQTAGRGRMGAAWQAAADDHLAMSLVLRPEWLGPADLPVLNMQISLGILDALEELAPEADIRVKWPNDLMSGTRKLAGILIENVLLGKQVTAVIAGIGLNLNETTFPDDLPFAVSVRQLTDRRYPPEDTARLIRHHVIAITGQARPDWRTRYRNRLFGAGELHAFKAGDSRVEGWIRGVDDEGRLLLQSADGDLRAYYSHQLTWQRP